MSRAAVGVAYRNCFQIPSKRPILLDPLQADSCPTPASSLSCFLQKSYIDMQAKSQRCDIDLPQKDARAQRHTVSPKRFLLMPTADYNWLWVKTWNPDVWQSVSTHFPWSTASPSLDPPSLPALSTLDSSCYQYNGQLPCGGTEMEHGGSLVSTVRMFFSSHLCLLLVP